MKNILEYIEAAAARAPEKTVIGTEQGIVCYKDFLAHIQNIGTFLNAENVFKKPVAVLAGKDAVCLELAFGAVAAGGFYTILDDKMPAERISKILGKLRPAMLLTDRAHYEAAVFAAGDTQIAVYEDIVETQADFSALEKVRAEQIDTDVLYILFTSGSTGNPKGVVVTHRSVLAYTAWVTQAFGFDAQTVFGSQTPFYFSMSVTDIFSALSCAATIEVIPKALFSFPVELIRYLNDKKINTIYWVPSALSIVANFKTFSAIRPAHLQKVLFAGEVMPTKQLNYWIDSLSPDILYANLFGPTETTDICTFYKLNRRFRNDEGIPIGRHCDNCGVLIVDENGRESDCGELYARGSFLAAGYYNDPEKTAAVFVQNPLQNAYPETVYKTGDLVKVNPYGEIEYLSRKDFQIKHMGYRIELGEIENSLNVVDSVKSCACVYDAQADKIVFVFEGKKQSSAELCAKAEAALPAYMRPNVYVRVRTMPTNANGKTDRKYLTANYQNLK